MGTRNNSMVSKLVLTGFGGGQERNLVGKPVAMGFGNSALPVAPLLDLPVVPGPRCSDFYFCDFLSFRWECNGLEGWRGRRQERA